MPDMPAGLEFVDEGYTIQAPGGVSRIDVGGGMPRYGLEWDRGCEQVPGTMVLDEIQFMVWTAFYHHVIKMGAVPFNMPLNTGAGRQTHSVQIVPGTYTAAAAGAKAMRVSFTAQTESSAYALSEAEALAMIAAFEAAQGAPLLELLRPVVSGYSMDGPDALRASEIPGGAGGIAAVWERASQRFQVTLVFTRTEFEVWNAYFHHVAKKGALAFPMYLNSGFGPGQHQVNIVPGSYSAAISRGGRAVVSFVAEAEPDAYSISHSDAQSLIDLLNDSPAGLGPLLDRLATLANHDIEELA